MGLDVTLDDTFAFRMNKKELAQITKTVRYAEDIEGFRKYENESHFVRCAVMNLLRVERENLNKERGRPKSKSKERKL